MYKYCLTQFYSTTNKEERKSYNMKKSTIKGYPITEATDGTHYNKKLLVLHTKNQATKDEFHRKFNELLSILNKYDRHGYENTICDNNLTWLSNIYSGITEQKEWLKSFEIYVKDVESTGKPWIKYSYN